MKHYVKIRKVTRDSCSRCHEAPRQKNINYCPACWSWKKKQYRAKKRMALLVSKMKGNQIERGLGRGKGKGILSGVS